MATYKLEDGTEIEAFTKEELDAEVAKAVSAKDDEHAKAIEEKESELKKLQEKDNNFSKVKKGSEEQIAALQKEIADLRGTVVGNHKTTLLKKLSGGDAEIEKKIDFEYSQFQGDAVSNEQIEERMFKAYKLAVPDVQADTLSSALSSIGSRSKDSAGIDQSKPSSSEKAIGDMMGITDEDRKKYAPQPADSNKA